MSDRTALATCATLIVAVGCGFSATARADHSDSHAEESASDHWAFQPLVEPSLPEVRNSLWPKSPIDLFILRRLEEAGLSAAPPADRRTLIRRATFDLIGLPPTPQEIDAFVADAAPGAFARVVDRLLNSPHYGEHWGRHWLDVARYADSNGLDENAAHANAWRYRDYVISAFNGDKPYNEFVREQLAGDLLTSDDPQARNQQVIATGFLSLGPKVLAEVDKTKMEMDIIDEQIDALGRALLGLTIGCARCHDHKFDPVTMEDYYALAGIFKSTRTMETFKTIARWNENRLVDHDYEQAAAAFDAQRAAAQGAVDTLLADATATLQAKLGSDSELPDDLEAAFKEETRAELKRLRDVVVALDSQAPKQPTAMGVCEGQPCDLPVHLRGSHLTLGDIVPRGLPTLFLTNQEIPLSDDASGRLELAECLTSATHPLASRVIVNRVWRWHFGRGLVATPDNFGTMGKPPTHPDLLDWLALKFTRDGWSMKRLHRLLMLSAVYQTSSRGDPRAAAMDPENRLRSRAHLRRLSAEELRDAVLAVSGQLDRRRGGPSIETENFKLVFDHTSKDDTTYLSLRRSVYLPVIRNHLHDSFTLFDYADASVPVGDRPTSTVASQALYMMNSPLLRDAAVKLADRVATLNVARDDQRFDWVIQQTFGREAEEAEISLGQSFLERLRRIDKDADHEQSSRSAWRLFCQALLMSHEFVYVR